MKTSKPYTQLLTNIFLLIPSLGQMIFPFVLLNAKSNHIPFNGSWLKNLMILLFYLMMVTGSIKAQVDTQEFTISVDQQQLNIQEVLSRYLQIPSVSGQEKEAGEFYENNLRGK